jgi:hypothetical protein
MLFGTGRWDDALAEIAAVPEGLKEPVGACCDLGISAMIALHRGNAAAARGHLAAADPYAGRIGHRVVPSLALARSLNHEQAGDLPLALAALTCWTDRSTEELEAVQDLVTDAVRLAAKGGELATT